MRLGFRHVDSMAPPDIPARLLRLAEALVFASPRPATWRLLAPFLPAHLSADDVFAAYVKKNEVNFKRQESGYTAKDHDDSKHI